MILLLAGTAEARNLASYLTDAGIDCIASLAGATRNPADLAVPTRHGGFGGADGFCAFLEAENITAVIDATHPFAEKITARTAQICKARDLPYLRFERAQWISRTGDAWHRADSYADLDRLIPKSARVFVATGRQSLAHYADLQDRHLMCRVIDAPDADFPYPNGEWIVGRPPFSQDSEMALFQKLKPDWLVVKNSGGASGKTKLAAARALGIQVAMMTRPKEPIGIERREQICDALDWAEQWGG
ncbi:precorrin-6A/cobalt-precorrin-6A reductase [Pacificibacter maritimus]|uniref:Precorrin-6A/cobalt-precorrin-6A reductase n=1 Tax=Pacificibacter maritimus TaxID=762213 RepID=A0A3N4US92_9RHOB|nr:cobalt-precorrin-6A reductase [Pacificibacter maritimus]RPE71555.1 precorrin-6A/cobalt-precorrin-6A reductase [Pacificibacter maritimus]